MTGGDRCLAATCRRPITSVEANQFGAAPAIGRFLTLIAGRALGDIRCVARPAWRRSGPLFPHHRNRRERCPKGACSSGADTFYISRC